MTLVVTPTEEQPIIDPITPTTPATPNTPRDSTADLAQCIATCNEKCKSEIAEKKDACVNLCVN